jgi:hypothetical protein
MRIIREIVHLLRELLETLWGAGPPTDWDEQCQEALAEDEQVPWKVANW